MNSEAGSDQSAYDKWASYFKKYKALLLSILVFIVLDLSILLFNFYISYQISNNAAIINVAAKQEVLSQKISKNLLVFERAYNKSIPYNTILNEIERSLSAFDQSLTAFDKGGQLQLGDGALINVGAISDEAGRQAIEIAKPMWSIYKNYTSSVLDEFRNNAQADESLVTIFSREYLIKSVVGYTARNNVTLLNVLEKLTSSIEKTATQKTRQLRLIQLFGILLAVINFFYIMFYSLKKIQRKDQALADAKKEVEVMLNAITEGVVLIDSSLVIREHYSTEMEKIFNRTDFVKKSLIDILHEANCEESADVIKTYIMRWFDMSQDVKSLVQHNPIAEVQIYNSASTLFNFGKKHLTISFSRIYQQQGGVAFLLVRFKDVTDHIEQYLAVTDERANQQKQLNLMSALINADVDALPGFFHRGSRAVERMQRLVSYHDGELAGVSESLLQVLKPFRQECQSYTFDTISAGLEELEAIVRESILGSVNVKNTEKDLIIILDKLSVELQSIYDFASQLLGERWSKHIKQTTAS